MKILKPMILCCFSLISCKGYKMGSITTDTVTIYQRTETNNTVTKDTVIYLKDSTKISYKQQKGCTTFVNTVQPERVERTKSVVYRTDESLKTFSKAVAKGLIYGFSILALSLIATYIVVRFVKR